MSQGPLSERQLEDLASVLRDHGYGVEAPLDLPYVAIGAGERAPWANLPLSCPTCGVGPLPLQDAEHVSGDNTGINLRFIRHCGGSWLRGDIR